MADGQINYVGPDPIVQCAFPPCGNTLRRADVGGPQFCCQEHRDGREVEREVYADAGALATEIVAMCREGGYLGDDPIAAVVGLIRFGEVFRLKYETERRERQKLADQLVEIERRLRERFTMAREVLEAEGLGHVAALVPIEEVLIWIEEVCGG